MGDDLAQDLAVAAAGPAIVKVRAVGRHVRDRHREAARQKFVAAADQKIAAACDAAVALDVEHAVAAGQQNQGRDRRVRAAVEHALHIAVGERQVDHAGARVGVIAWRAGVSGSDARQPAHECPRERE